MKNLEMKMKNGILIAELSGEIDHHIATEMRNEIDSAMEHYNLRDLVLDYSKVSFMDSSGIGLVMGRYKNVRRKNGTIVVVPGSQYVSRILGLSGIFSIVPKSRSCSMAVQYISEKGGMRS
jgi:stage II sporulation protein AA (anti-sigma F factor antagonist)